MVARRHLGHAEPQASSQSFEAVRSLIQPLKSPADLDSLLERIGDNRYVLLGEASHGTHEYYTWRAALSQRLIEEKGFSFIAVEGDWPDCYRVNRYLKGYADSGESAREVLHRFDRWPTWMWANEEIVELAEWLRAHNERQSPDKKVGFYGLDVYSLWDSLHQVVAYVAKHDRASLPAARRALACFEPYGEDVHEYGRASRWFDASCEDEVMALLTEMRRAAPAYPRDGQEAYFNAEQNALVIKNAEHYYRTMVQGGPESWNIRDRHMTETLNRLMKHHGPDTKAIVWAHNTHIGDARFTDMVDDGMVNIGELVRTQHAKEGVSLIGFGSYRGTVMAGDEWEAPMERMTVPPGRPDSWEDILNRVTTDNGLLLFDKARTQPGLLRARGHRAIGVVYHPAYEQYGNYVPTVLPRRYDAFLFFKETKALAPLHAVKARAEGEVPETYPSGV